MSNDRSTEIVFVGVLIIALIVLKLTKVVTWPWWWVLAAIWGSAISAVLAFIIFGGK